MVQLHVRVVGLIEWVKNVGSRDGHAVENGCWSAESVESRMERLLTENVGSRYGHAD
jgi:hypothetical protein